MADNFKDTAYRMHESSGILYEKQQWFNANYLGGYVLECYCKLILSVTLACGEQLSRVSVQNYRHDINSMKTDIDLILLNGGSAVKYCIDLNTTCGNIISSWNPNYRYESSTYCLNSNNLAEKINEEMNRLMDTILEMDVDGVIV